MIYAVITLLSVACVTCIASATGWIYGRYFQ